MCIILNAFFVHCLEDSRREQKWKEVGLGYNTDNKVKIYILFNILKNSYISLKNLIYYLQFKILFFQLYHKYYVKHIMSHSDNALNLQDS